jgi:hypothetical protein
MSITELVALGLPREYLKRLSRIEDAPIIRTAARGKILFITTDLDKFIKDVTEREKRKYLKHIK